MNEPVRKKNRLLCYDYSSSGGYFITLCVEKHKKILSSIDAEFNRVGERIALPRLTEIGKIVENAIEKINEKYPAVFVDKYVIMPNHIHMILRIDGGSAMRSPTIPTVINQLKGYVTKQIGFSIWQKSFYDHIIRSEKDFLAVYQYIETNPLKWENDEYYT